MTEPNPIANAIERAARNSPDKPFIESIDQRKSITYGQFEEATQRLAAFLDQRGIKPNERIMLLSDNSLEHLLVYFGLIRYGATVCTPNLEANRFHLPRILKAAKPKLVLFENRELAKELKEPGAEWIELGEWQKQGGSGFFAALGKLKPTSAPKPINSLFDDAFIVYTSGTTAVPKGVMARFIDIAQSMEDVAVRLGLTPSDRLLEFRNMSWLSPQAVTWSVLWRGMTLILARKFSHSNYFDWVKNYRVTVGICVPSAISMMINRPLGITAADVPSLRYVTSSTAPLALEHLKAFEETYRIPIAQGYGCSESLSFIAWCDETTRRLGSVGLPLRNQNMKIIAANGGEAPRGEIGEIEVGGYGEQGEKEYRYLDQDGAIKIAAKGRFRTGDLGYLDEQGYLYVTGRVKDLIIRGGVNIAPAEIDNILLQVEGVAEAATIGVPDKIYGEEVIAYLACKPGSTVSKEAVLAHCARQLPPFKQPKEVIFKEALPRTALGKSDRKALLEEWKSGH